MTRRIPLLACALAAAAGATAACGRSVPPLPSVDVAVHRDSIEQWHKFRQNAIYGPTGWATLLGFWWIKPGETSLGWDLENTIALPKDRAPRNLGTVWADRDSARFVAAPGAKVFADTMTTPVGEIRLHPDYEEHATTLRAGSLQIQYLVREDRGVFRPAIRIKDTLSAARVAPPLRYFPTDIKWRVQASYKPVAGADSLNIIGVLGTETKMAHPGNLSFQLEGKPFTLMVIREPEDHTTDLFVMFTDSTNRKETYPSTRYVWVSPPDSLGRTVIDFNKAYNPPCAFTRFATCPFPPKGNHIPVYITAGEWNPHYVEHLAK
ncbi:MAG TPA: DUF1684 domain-containing protein [Gemmatimonadaceae bacterium]|nr:DUF1684 domain-containing protein [Gemmatimonadaceae bacterium]